MAALSRSATPACASRAGQCVALIGSNGAGKTTLLHTICGLMRPASGNITFRDTDITGQPAYRVARQGMLLVPEGRQILGPLIGTRKSRARAPRARRASEAVRTPNLEAVLELFPRLAERLEQLAGSLSGGEQQMLAIGRALMGSPDLLLLDEPSLGLAPIVVGAVFDTLKRPQRGGPHHSAGRAECAARSGDRRLRLCHGARAHRR